MESVPGSDLFLRRGGDCIAQWFNQHPDTQTWAQRVPWPHWPRFPGKHPRLLGIQPPIGIVHHLSWANGGSHLRGWWVFPQDILVGLRA